jgi:hypothetical protein
LFCCYFEDILNAKAKRLEDANKFVGSVTLDGVEVDTKRSFTEMYSSSPEPKIPVSITYHWTVFRAVSTTGKLTASDWPNAPESGVPFGQEQTFNFVEIQPYHE